MEEILSKCSNYDSKNHLFNHSINLSHKELQLIKNYLDMSIFITGLKPTFIYSPLNKGYLINVSNRCDCYDILIENNSITTFYTEGEKIPVRKSLKVNKNLDELLVLLSDHLNHEHIVCDCFDITNKKLTILTCK